MPIELKKHIINFVETLDIAKKGELYNSIIKHYEYNRKKRN
jgi:hypothetical protein